MKLLTRSALSLACAIALSSSLILAANPKDPGFDLINKTGKPVTIRVVNGDQASIEKAIVEPAKTLLGKTLKANSKNAPLDISQPTMLIVWDKAMNNPKDEILTVGVGIADAGTEKFFYNWTIKPKPNFVYHFKPGKSIYVTLDKNGELRPQSGPLKGITGKTEAGFPLKNIVKKDEILRYKGITNPQTGALEEK
ncbi:hypothetical protein H0X06_03510 [Candidatus Dependentiae bacterium]|nr:hypothetical protein [Candidatus Dependentiae bacterium]